MNNIFKELPTWTIINIKEVIDMSEIIETLEGCIMTLENMDEDAHDSRYYMIMAALRWVLDRLDEPTQQGE